MRCPDCQHADSKVVDSRTHGESIRRRRQCGNCGARFTTYERLEQRVLWVKKKGGHREPYSVEKVLHGIALACHKRQVGAPEMEAAARRVEAAFEGRSEVSAEEVGQTVMDVLSKLDPVAAIRFASVYQAFESVEQFVEAIAPLQDAK